MADRKVRVRKAPATSEQADASRVKLKASTKPSNLHLFRFLIPIMRPLRWLVPTYFINSWREVRQVTWPSRRETWRLALAVFIFAVVFGVLIAGVDKGLDLIFKKVILKQ